MVRKFAVLSGAAAGDSRRFHVASAPAYSVPAAPVKAGSSVMLVKKGSGGKKWNKGGGNKHGNKNGGNWNDNGKNYKWSGKGHGGQNGASTASGTAAIVIAAATGVMAFSSTLPFIVGDQCYDYLDYRDGAPRAGLVLGLLTSL